MAIDGFHEIFNVVYIAKKLCDMGKHELVAESFHDSLDYDTYYENMYSLLENLFGYGYCRYSECRNLEVHILSDPVIVDFFILAGKYGKRNNIPDENNPYIKAAEREAGECLNISHCLDWKLKGHTEPKRPYHSKLGLFISQDCGCLDLGVLVYRLIELYEWFADQCAALCNILHENASGQLILDLEAMAA